MKYQWFQIGARIADAAGAIGLILFLIRWFHAGKCARREEAD